MNRRQVLLTTGCINFTIFSGCTSLFNEGKVDLELINYTSTIQLIDVRIEDSSGDVILNKNYEISGRDSDQRSVPSIEEHGFTESTNGDRYDVYASLEGEQNQSENGIFEINCIGEENASDVFFIKIQQRRGHEYIEFSQSYCGN